MTEFDSDWKVSSSRNSRRQAKTVAAAKTKQDLEEAEILKAFANPLPGEMLIRLTMECHEEDHTGYCSGAGVEIRRDHSICQYIRTFSIDLDEDGDINLDQFKVLNETFGCLSGSHHNVQRLNGYYARSCYCACSSTRQVSAAHIVCKEPNNVIL